MKWYLDDTVLSAGSLEEAIRQVRVMYPISDYMLDMQSGLLGEIYHRTDGEFVGTLKGE